MHLCVCKVVLAEEGRGRATEIEGTPIALYCFPSFSIALNVLFRLRSGQHHCNVLGRGGGGRRGIPWGTAFLSLSPSLTLDRSARVLSKKLKGDLSSFPGKGM